MLAELGQALVPRQIQILLASSTPIKISGGNDEGLIFICLVGCGPYTHHDFRFYPGNRRTPQSLRPHFVCRPPTIKQQTRLRVILLGIGPRPASGKELIFEDNFDAENGGIGIYGHDSFINWNVTVGDVDLVGNGFDDFYPGVVSTSIWMDSPASRAGGSKRRQTCSSRQVHTSWRWTSEGACAAMRTTASRSRSERSTARRSSGSSTSARWRSPSSPSITRSIRRNGTMTGPI